MRRNFVKDKGAKNFTFIYIEYHANCVSCADYSFKKVDCTPAIDTCNAILLKLSA